MNRPQSANEGFAMKRLSSTLLSVALIALALPTASVSAADKPFPKIIYTPSGSAPEGFTIGKGTTAYNGSLDGSIYKLNLRTGQGEVLVAKDPNADVANGTCHILGMRVDPRTNYLFVAGCDSGNAYVYDAGNGHLIMEYQLAQPGLSIINDLAITKDAVFFTDAAQPFLYRLPLSRNGAIPLNAGAATAIRLPDVFVIDPADFCCGANGIVATPDGKTLIVGHSLLAQLYRIDTSAGDVEQIYVDAPLDGFLDGIAMKGRTLYIMTPSVPNPESRIQVVELNTDLRSGKLAKTITDPDLDDVASGAIFGNSLYGNTARYSQFPGGDTEYWVTKLRIRP
jgi:sugar lactone lactonase YvrE